MRTFLIVNGGRGVAGPPQRLLASLKDAVDAAGEGSTVAVSYSLDDAKRLVDQAAHEGYEALWMGGGDGTINVLLNHAFGSGMVFGVVPMGTVNALARSLGIPLDPVAAAWRLVSAKVEPFDVLQVAGRKFLCFASIGFDAAVVHEVTGDFKRQWGRAAYMAAGLRALVNSDRIARFNVEFDRKQADAEATVDLEQDITPVGLQQEGYSLVVSKICNYAGLHLFPRVEPCSGTMEMWLFRRNRPDDIVAWIAGASVGEYGTPLRHLLTGSVGHYMTKGFTVRSDQPLYLQIDGEAVELESQQELRFECHPGAAKLLVPRIRGVWE